MPAVQNPLGSRAWGWFSQHYKESTHAFDGTSGHGGGDPPLQRLAAGVGPGASSEQGAGLGEGQGAGRAGAAGVQSLGG